MQRMHRLILGLEPEDERQGDHANRNTLDNRKNNLRIATPSQNNANSRNRNGTSQYKGVSWSRKDKRWRVQIAGRHIGNFKNEIEAAKSYDAAAKKLFGEYANPNFAA